MTEANANWTELSQFVVEDVSLVRRLNNILAQTQ